MNTNEMNATFISWKRLIFMTQPPFICYAHIIKDKLTVFISAFLHFYFHVHSQLTSLIINIHVLLAKKAGSTTWRFSSPPCMRLGLYFLVVANWGPFVC